MTKIMVFAMIGMTVGFANADSVSDDEIRDMIRRNCRNWDFSRMALMDVIIIQIAAAEVIAFPEIPLNATFNEYIEIAKYYSTPRSASYVHGMLDSIVKKLKADGAIVK